MICHIKCLLSCLSNNLYLQFISSRYLFKLYKPYKNLFRSQIHWFSIFNSFMMVIFLTGLVSMILMRTLRNDYAKYAREDDDLESLVMFPQTFMYHNCTIVFAITTLFSWLFLYCWGCKTIRDINWCAQERDVNEESGWKLVHGDVFRPPWSLVLLSAVVGTGAQLALLVLLVILIAIVGTLYVGYVLHSSSHLPPTFRLVVSPLFFVVLLVCLYIWQ